MVKVNRVPMVYRVMRLVEQAKRAADRAYTQLERHDRTHGCASMPGVTRPYCPFSEELQITWYRLAQFRDALLWLLGLSDHVPSSFPGPLTRDSAQ